MFEIMITPVLMTMLYYLGCVGIVVATGIGMAMGFEGFHWIQILIAGAASMLAWRIMCEFIVVRFRMYEVLTEIRDGMRKGRIEPTVSDTDNKPEPQEPKIRQWARDNNLGDWGNE